LRPRPRSRDPANRFGVAGKVPCDGQACGKAATHAPLRRHSKRRATPGPKRSTKETSRAGTLHLARALRLKRSIFQPRPGKDPR
jgi:hypothetical protein